MHDDCAQWARRGECQTNAETMVRNCPTSCGICTPTCKDMMQSCVRWAAEGACSDNSSYMLKLCPVACGVCDLECKARRLTLHTCRRQPD